MTSNRLEGRRTAIIRQEHRWKKPKIRSGLIDEKQLARERGWFALLDEFATLNGVSRSRSFTLDALSRSLCHGGAWGEIYRWPGCDHVNFFKRNRRAAMVVTEPYGQKDVDDLCAYAGKHGLVVHVPPNPLASIYFPGSTHFVVLTAPGFGEVQWLSDQLQFDPIPDLQEVFETTE